MDFKDCLTLENLERLTKSSGFQRNLAAFEETKMNGYIIFRNQNWDLANAYFRWCEITGKPYLRVRLFRKYAHVSLDLISCRGHFLEFGLTDEGINQVAALVEREYRFIKSSSLYKITKKQIYFGQSFADIERLPISRIDDFLKDLLAIMASQNDCLRKRKV